MNFKVRRSLPAVPLTKDPVRMMLRYYESHHEIICQQVLMTHRHVEGLEVLLEWIIT